MGLLQALSAINWEEESYPNYEDFIALPILVLFFLTVRFFLDRFVFEVKETSSLIQWRSFLKSCIVLDVLCVGLNPLNSICTLLLYFGWLIVFVFIVSLIFLLCGEILFFCLKFSSLVGRTRRRYSGNWLENHWGLLWSVRSWFDEKPTCWLWTN